VLERDNRGIGVDDPAGTGVVGSKRIYQIDISDATDVTDVILPAEVLPANVIAVSKSQAFIDLAANTVLPNGKIAEKWEGLAIGPRLKDGARAILAGNDNDYSVTQSGSGTQFDVYVDFNGITSSATSTSRRALKASRSVRYRRAIRSCRACCTPIACWRAICRLMFRRTGTTERRPSIDRQDGRHVTVPKPSLGLIVISQ
jgi:hypothetical protein